MLEPLFISFECVYVCFLRKKVFSKEPADNDKYSNK